MKKGLIVLSPLLLFVVLYLFTSLWAHDFYQVPITVPFLLSSIYAILISSKLPLRKRIEVYSRGAGSPSMMLMFWIFVLAGAFAHSAKVMGSIDSTVNLALLLLPGNLILAGLFLAACFISLSIGTSVGTIVALTPIAAGIAQSTGTDVALIISTVVGGAFFGDNLSFISDTTVMATSTQGCKMSDKFRVNIRIVLPAAILVFALYVYLGKDMTSGGPQADIDIWRILPYIAVLACAIAGMHVMAVLAIGIALTGLIGICLHSYDLLGWFQAMGSGITGMGELIIISMMAAGMLEIIHKNGGIDFILQQLSRRVHGRMGAEASIAALVCLVNVCTANNTVAILTVGGIARQVAQKYGVDPRRTASILDTSSCAIQGMLPYGAQLLMAGGLAAVNPISVVPYLYYPMAIGLATVLAILFRYPRQYAEGQPT